MKYSLTKVGSPYVGDSGPMSMLIWPVDGGQVETEQNARPRVGCSIRVGSPYARTFEAQDWWQTSLIQEILIDEPEYVKFRTMNSVYEWKIF